MLPLFEHARSSRVHVADVVFAAAVLLFYVMATTSVFTPLRRNQTRAMMRAAPRADDAASMEKTMMRSAKAMRGAR